MEPLQTVLLAFLGLLMFAAQVTPEQAVSNTSQWVCKALGVENPPRWLSAPNTDRLVRHGAQIGLVILLGWVLFQYLDFDTMQTGPRSLISVGLLLLLGGVVWHAARPDGRDKEIVLLKSQLAEAQRRPSSMPAPPSTLPNVGAPALPSPRQLTPYEIQTNTQTVDAVLEEISGKIRPAVLNARELVMKANGHTPRHTSKEDSTVYEKQLRDAGGAWYRGRTDFGELSERHAQAKSIVGALKIPDNALTEHLYTFAEVFRVAAERAQSDEEFDALIKPSRINALNEVENVKNWMDTSVNKLLELRGRTTAP